MCCEEIICENGFLICTCCGKSALKSIESTWDTSSYQQKHSPFSGGYTRQKRFRSLVHQLLFPTPCTADDAMVKYFVDNRMHPAIKDVETTLRMSGLRDKRYSSIHTFARLFSPDYVALPHGMLLPRERILQMHFERFESEYNRLFAGFLSYNFVLGFLLRGCGMHVYTKFIKRTKCKRRLREYNEKIKQLDFSFDIDGK